MTAQPTNVSEFDRQLETLLAKGYPEILGLSEQKFRKNLEPLKAQLPAHMKPLEDGSLPFVIVVNSPLLSAEKALSLVDFKGKNGLEKMHPRKPEDFTTISSVQIPEGLAYLLLDIDRGAEFLNVVPAEALKAIQARGRSPLTIAEGTALLTQHPEFLKKNNCFSLSASRYFAGKPEPADQRVPALWISEGRPKLGWCWDGNPHTWLGSASSGGRIGL